MREKQKLSKVKNEFVYKLWNLFSLMDEQCIYVKCEHALNTVINSSASETRQT